jgi:hypothetical protein
VLVGQRVMIEPKAGRNIKGNVVCAAASIQKLKQKLTMQLLALRGEVAVRLDVFEVSLLKMVPIRGETMRRREAGYYLTSSSFGPIQ